MSSKLKVVAVSGGLKRPSRTLTLVEELINAISAIVPIELHLIELGNIGPRLGSALQHSDLSDDVRADIAAIESADFLIAATPRRIRPPTRKRIKLT